MPEPRPATPFLRRLRRAAIAAVAACGVVAAVPAPASAGDYTVYSCQLPNGAPHSSAGWSFASHGSYIVTRDTCAQGAGLVIGLGEQARPFGDSATLTLTAPDDVKVAAAQLEWEPWLAEGPQADPGGTPEFDIFRDEISLAAPYLVANCNFYLGCRHYGGRHPLAIDLGDRPAQKLIFHAVCTGQTSGWCAAPKPGWHRATFTFFNARLTMRDATEPQGANFEGTLLQAGARSGVESLVFAASDKGAGVYQAIVEVEGREVKRETPSANGGSCADAGFAAHDLEFRSLRPCPLQVQAQLAIDTRTLPEGNPLVTVKLRDAAGNVASVLQRRIAVDNVPPPSVKAAPVVSGDALRTGLRPGDVVSAVDGAWEGAAITFTRRWQRSTETGWIDIPNAVGGSYGVSAADVGRQLRVVVRATNSEGSAEAASEATPVVESGATVQTQSRAPQPSCESCNGAGGDAATGHLVVDREQRSVQVRHGAKVVITGRLVDAEGRPLAEATLDVFERLEVTAAPWTKVATVKTDSQGGYAYRPKTTASRSLRFAYAARRGEADYRATRDVTVSVAAGMPARALKRVVRSRGLIALKGRVQVDGLPRTGTWVEVQVLDAGVWRTIGTRKTTRTGLWSFKHRLRRTSGLTFKFRARLRTSGDVASAPAVSAPVKVRVR